MNNQDTRKTMTGKVRFSYVHLTKPRAATPGGALKYGVTILIPKNDIATRQKIDFAISEAIKDGISTKWGGQRPAMPAIPIYDGDGVKQSGEAFGEECRGHWVLTANTTDRPEVVDLNLTPIIDQTEIYSGMYGRVTIKFFAYANTGKKGIGCALGNVQKLADGEPLAGSYASAADDFSDGSQGAINSQPQYGRTTNIDIYPQAPAYPAPVYPQQPQYGYAPAPAAPVYPQQPQQYPTTAAPQIDPITGKPLVGQIMGL